MTEAEWRTSVDRSGMLYFASRRGDDRQLRLFACACCRRVWDALPGEASRRAVEAAEGYVEQEVDFRGLTAAAKKANAELFAAKDRETKSPAIWLADRLMGEQFAVKMSADDAIACAFAAALPRKSTADRRRTIWEKVREEEQAYQIQLLRDIFGPPFFRHLPRGVTWLTPAANAIAQNIYTERAFSRMPELTRDLESAGCEQSDILAHCRGDGPHVRGCWVVDWILGKSGGDDDLPIGFAPDHH